MEQFGLIGRTLKHSYSKKIHSLFGDYPYDLYELEPCELEKFLFQSGVKGFNVTIPYKQSVIPYLDHIDPMAKEMGAVNTVVRNGNKLYGYNTDFLGMEYMLKSAGISLKGKKVMVLGSGGTSHTAVSVAKAHGAREVVIVSRTGEVNYLNYKDQNDAEIIINTTPVGMYPNVYESPIDLSEFSSLVGVVDVIYNPSKTALTFSAEKLGVKAVNGLSMLVAQAKFAVEKFLDKIIDDKEVERVIKSIEKQTKNVILIGMPGAGKTAVGKSVAERLGREFIDLDEEIVKREKRDIPTIFAENGEEYFRAVESAVLKDICAENGKVISTGGGVVKDSRNEFPLKANGTIFYIKRDLNKLASDGRPLSKDKQAIESIYQQRKGLYEKFADFEIDNNGKLSDAVEGVKGKL